MYEIKNYPMDSSYHNAFEEIRLFLNTLNESYDYIHFHWSRWEWMFARHSFKLEQLSQIKRFYQNGSLVGVSTIEDEDNVLFLIYLNDKNLKSFIVETFVKEDITDDLIIPDDQEMIDMLLENGYEQMDWIDPITKFNATKLDIKEIPEYDLITLEQDYRLDQIHKCLHLGFDHGDDITYTQENLDSRQRITSSPNFKKKYTYVARYQDEFVAYAGVWYEEHTNSALIEPVATTPKHRRKGLAKQLIYRAIESVYSDGAKDVFVGSNRDVYLNMGFEPFKVALRFKRKNN